MYITGLIIAIGTFLVIGAFHPIVIKTEYYLGTRPWWLFLVSGVTCVAGSLCIANTIASALVGVAGASLLWSIGELFEQKKRVEKGWFPMNPKRRNAYHAADTPTPSAPQADGKAESNNHTTLTH